jgi:DNA-binding NtrC family response regulator
MHNVLVVDDELSIRESFSLILEGKYRLLLAASGEAALKTVADQKVDMVYLDIRMPGLDGLETLKRMKEIDPDLEVIMVTAVNDVQKAGEAVKLGARDYVVKPFDVNHILNLSERILRKKAIVAEGVQAQKKAQKEPPELVGQHEKISQISKIIDGIKKEARVLILGEVGTEKETVARIIHERSPRAALSLEIIDLSADLSLPEMKTRFFGLGKGGSTVELEARTGVFEKSRNGTILINNLEHLPPEIYKIISCGEFARAGSLTKIKIETRLIGASSADLAARDKELFDYFSEAVIHLPPLRERGSDIPILINHFLDKYNARYGKNVKAAPSALEALSSYPWPGNTHELGTLMGRLVLTASSDQILPEDLPLDMLLSRAEGTGSGFLPLFEKEYIRSVLEKSGKNKERAAAFLGVKTSYLETKL